MRVEYPEQRPDREVTEGTGASSSRDGAGNEQELRGDPLQCLNHNHAQLNRVSVMASPQENKVMLQTWPILTVTGGDPESRLGRKEKQRESGSMSLVAKKAMDGWRPKRNGCEFTVVPDEIRSLPMTQRRESIVCSADGGERRIVDRWRDEESENRMHGENCRMGNKETPQDLPHEWTGSTKLNRRRRSSNVPGLVQHALGIRCETPHDLLKKSISSKLIYEQRVTFLTFDPLRSKARSGTSEREKISAKFCG